MKLPLAALLATILLAPACPAQIASSTSSSSNASVVASQAVAPFSQALVASVHLTGTAHAIAGSTDETGTFTFDVQRAGESNLQIQAGALTQDETSSAFEAAPACTWSGKDGVKHAAAEHNCLLSVNWILPAMGVESRGTKLSITPADNPVDSSPAISVSVAVKGTKKGVLRYAKLTTALMALDATSLPRWLSYNIHPDDDENTDIPILVRYSDYRQVSGATIPFHIQKYINNGLALDLQVENATVQ
jgi:hypothetical protein